MPHPDELMLDLTIAGEVIHTTPDQPFYAKYKGWMAAGALQLGNLILRADDTYGTAQCNWSNVGSKE